MAALTDNLSAPETLERNGLKSKWTILNADKLYAGAILAVDYTDEIQNATNTAGLRVIGRCPEYVDNTSDGETVSPEQGIFRYANSSTYTIPRSSIGLPCYVEDNQTVGSYASNMVSAGLVFDVDTDGVWVDMRPAALRMARLLTPAVLVSKTAEYTITAALAFEGRTIFSCDEADGVTLTLPSAVGGYRFGVKRASATAAHDIKIQAATGDKVQGYDGLSAASKCVDNTVDAVSDVIWYEAADDTHWLIQNPVPADVASWVKNDA